MKNLSGRSDRPWELMGVFKDEFILEFNGGIYSDVNGICDKYNFCMSEMVLDIEMLAILDCF